MTLSLDTPPAGTTPDWAPRAHRIRVCHVMSADLWAGAEVQVATTASYLVRQPDVSLSAVLLNEGALAAELRRLGVPVFVVDERRHGPVGILLRLSRLLRQMDADIVHTHRYKDTILGSVAAKLAGVPHLIRTVHGLAEPMRGWDRLKFRLYEALDHAVLRRCADLVVAVSRPTASVLEHSGIGRALIACVPNGIDVGRVRSRRAPAEVRRELGVKEGALLIGTAGRLAPVKGHAYLLRAARMIREQEPDARFLIVGGGPLQEELRATARGLGLSDACIFTGPRSDVHDLVAAMDIFVLPSLDEGIPMALLEAMALKKPVVATAVGGVVEMVTHRTTGLLVAPRDAAALARACLELAQNAGWALSLGSCARRIVEQEFSHERGGRILVDLYRRTLARRTTRATPRSSGGLTEGPPRPARIGATTLLQAFARRSVDWARRRLGLVAAARRMAQVRRNPAPVLAALRSANRVLIVCSGNIIRSPFAARLAARALDEGRTVCLTSSGLDAVPGRPAHPTAVLEARARGVDLTGHTASRLDPEMAASADVIFVMDLPQLVEIERRFAAARLKTFVLTCLAPETRLEIRDPVDGTAREFAACFDHVSRALRPVVHALSDVPERR